MAGRMLLLRAEPGQGLPAFERVAPPPPPALVAARLETASGPGDIVLDPFGRGGWVARAAIDRQRKAFTLETTPLDRLLAEVVLRPPDLRHFDAAVQALAASARRDSSLKVSISDRYASRCATCDRPVVLDEVAWSDVDGTPRPVSKHYRCPVCRDQLGGGEARTAPLDEADLGRAMDPDDGGLRRPLADRFPVLDGGGDLPGELLALHTPRQLSALGGILERIEDDMRSPSIEAGLRLALLHAVVPASRLAGAGGRVAALRISGGHVKAHAPGTWRERNPWLAFEDGVRIIRAFIQHLDSGLFGPVPARLGDGLRSLTEGSATVVLRTASQAALGAIELELEHLPASAERPKVRLVLGVPPQRPVAERVAWVYHGTCWALGRGAASALALEPLFSPGVRPSWGWQAATITKTLQAIAPILATDARVVLLLEGEGPETMVACALGGAAAGYRVAAARLPEPGREAGGVVELVPPGSGAVPGGPRTRANVVLPLVPGGAGDPDLAHAERLFAPPERRVDAPFSAADAERAVADAAVDLLKLRGEPVTFGGLLGEVLVGLDRGGHLRRLVRPPAGPAAGEGSSPPPPVDHVEQLLELVRAGLAGADGRRLGRVDGDRWWLGDRGDREAAAVPLADRVEWAVYSLLSTAGPLTESAFLDRVAGLFTGPDLPDETLVRACLASYASATSTPDRLHTDDDLVRRTREHCNIIAGLVGLGHRLGFACWIGARQQQRRSAGGRLADLLDERELAGPPSIGRIRGEDLEDVDVIWYVRGRAAFVWEVEWTAMLDETVLRRHARLPADERLVRFLVVLAARVDLIRFKLERSPLLRGELEAGGWHLAKANHLMDWAARDEVSMADMEPLLGLDPAVERTGDQLALFNG